MWILALPLIMFPWLCGAALLFWVLFGDHRDLYWFEQVPGTGNNYWELYYRCKGCGQEWIHDSADLRRPACPICGHSLALDADGKVVDRNTKVGALAAESGKEIAQAVEGGIYV